MPFKIAHRKEADVPTPYRRGKVNADLELIKSEASKLAKGMVLEIETGSAKAVRRTKGLITRAGNQLGVKMEHWHQGSKVFAKRAEAVRARARAPRRAPRSRQ